MNEIDRIKEQAPEVYRHLVGLIKAIIKLLTLSARGGSKGGI